MEWKMELQVLPGMYFVWGASTGGVKAAEIDYSGHVIFYGYPNSVMYTNNNEFAVAEKILYWFGPILNPFGQNA